MAARSVDTAGRGVRRVPPVTRPAAYPAIRLPLRPRLIAIAPSVAEAVRFAGGWLFDQVMAGWDVTVLTCDHGDSRPLRILGARAVDLETVLARPVRGPCLQAIAVRGDLYGTHAGVRQMVLGLGESLAEIRFWGEGPEDLHGTAGPVRHRLSTAARAFKAQALAAAAAPADPDEVAEVFRKGEIRRPSQVAVQ